MIGASDGQDAEALLASPIRRRIVAHLAEAASRARDADPADGSDGAGAAELAELLGLHVTTVRFHLDRLVAAGLLTTAMEHRDGVGRPRKLYRATPEASTAVRPAPDATASFEALAGLLAEAWQGDRDGGHLRTPAEAGAAWARQHVAAALADEPDPRPARSPGQWLGKVGVMLDLLRSWGYTSRVSTDTDGARIEIELRDCPFFGLARTHQEVVCGIHRGLLRGTLGVLGEEQVDVRLEPFVTPTSCRAHLQPRTAFAARQ